MGLVVATDSELGPLEGTFPKGTARAEAVDWQDGTGVLVEEEAMS